MEWRDIVENLGLVRHPEGGYYREIYRSDETIAGEALPSRYSGSRAFGTSIYFLLPSAEYSHFHRLKSDEIWHFYSGSPLVVHCIDEKGVYAAHRLGGCMTEEESFQVVIRKNTWFAAEVVDESGYALMGCSVMPGFDFSDFELGDREFLLARYPHHGELIARLTLR
ncbi:MAG: hypothetical protein CVV44_06095 [Spirochaetae bacterium HGW-Spirochaetae-1]|jgi:hypothetical protein|nr:MAG: hypothetical protein CVV44_06095 [Spirochaetae bacterium HGW-Spirochaetae-1]